MGEMYAVAESRTWRYVNYRVEDLPTSEARPDHSNIASVELHMAYDNDQDGLLHIYVNVGRSVNHRSVGKNLATYDVEITTLEMMNQANWRGPEDFAQQFERMTLEQLIDHFSLDIPA